MRDARENGGASADCGSERLKPRLLALLAVALVATTGAAVTVALPANSTCVWDASAGDGLWGTDANWTCGDGDHVPAATDTVVFDGTGGGTVTVGAARTVAALQTTSAFTGTISLGSNTLTVTGDFSVSSGSQWSSNTAGTLALTGDSATVTVPSSGFSTGNLTINGGSDSATKTVAGSGQITVTGNLTLTNGRLDQAAPPTTGTIDWVGNGSASTTISQASGFDGGDAIVGINGGNAQVFTGSNSRTAGALTRIRIAKSGGTLTFGTASNTVVRATNDWEYVSGTVATGPGGFILALAPQAGETLTWTGDNSGQPLNRVDLYAADSTGIVKIAAGSVLQVFNRVFFEEGRLDGPGVLEHVGSSGSGLDVRVQHGFDGSSDGSGKLRLAGSTNTITVGLLTGLGSAPSSTAGDFPDFEIARTGTAGVRLSGTIRTTNDWTVASNGSAGLTLCTAASAPDAQCAGASKLVFAAPAGGLTVSGNHVLREVEFWAAGNGNTATIASGTTLTTSNVLRLAEGVVNGPGDIEATAGVTVDPVGTAHFDGGTASLRFTGSSATFTGLNVTADTGLLPVEIAKTAGQTLTLAGTLRTGRNWTHTSGTVDPTTSEVVFTGGGTVSVVNADHPWNNVTFLAGTTTLSSDVTVNGATTFSGGVAGTGANALIANGAVSRTNGHVNGTLRKAFATGAVTHVLPVGGATAAAYRGVELAFPNVTVAGHVTASTTAGAHAELPDSGIDADSDVGFYWTLTPGGGLTFTGTYDATFNHTAAERSGTSTDYTVRRWSGTAWDEPSAVTAGADTTLATFSALSDFVVGEPGAVTVDGVDGTDGTYEIGDPVDITVTFSDSVTVSTTGGTPTLELETGAVNGTATYLSGSPGATLTFRYTVAEGHQATDLDYTASTALQLNGGSIVQTSDGTTAADLTLATPGEAGSLGANANIAIDGVRPVVSSIVRADPSPTNADDVDFTVTFSEAVSGVEAGDFALDASGAAATTIGAPAPTGGAPATEWTVNVSGITGDGTLSIDFTGTATDGAGNDTPAADFTGGAAYTIDNTAPTATSVVADGTTVTIDYDETLAANLPLTTNYVFSPAGHSVSARSITGDDVILTVTPAFEYLEDPSTLAYNGSAVRDPAGNAAPAFAGFSVTNDTASQAPTASTLVSPADDATFLTDSTPALTATFEDPDDNDTGRVDFEVCSDAACTTVVQSFSSPGGASPGASRSADVPTALADGEYHWRARGTDSAGLSSPNVVTRSFVVDVNAPSVVSSNRAATSPTNAATVDFTVTFSEAVTGVGTADFDATSTGSVAGASVTGVAGGPTVYTVSVATGTGDGTIRLDVVDDGSIDDLAGNSLAGGFTGGQTYTLDKTAPAFSSAVVNGATLTITMDEALDGAFDPAGGAFDVQVAGSGRTVTAVDAAGTTVTLTLQSAVSEGQTVTVAYAQPGVNQLRDAVGNLVATFPAQSVTNNTDGTAPARTGQAVDGATLTISFDEALATGAPQPVVGDFDVTVDGTSWTVSGVSVSGSTLTLTLTASVAPANSVQVEYTGGAIRDGSGNAAPAFGPVAVTNNTSGDAVTENAGPGVSGDVTAGGATVSWTATTFADEVAVTIDPTAVGTGGFSVAGTPIEVTVTRLSDGADISTLANQLRIEFPGAPADSTPIFSADGTTWQEVPDGIDPLPLVQEKGWFRDGTTAVVLVRTLTFFAISVPGGGSSAAPGVVGLIGPVYYGRQLVLRWTPAAGDVSSYTVYADGVAIASAGAAQYEHYIEGFTAGDARTFTVRARNAAGKEAPPSNAVRGIPDLVGSTLDQARAALAARGFVLGTVTEEPAAQPPGTVVRQDPAAPWTLEPGSAVDVVVAAVAEGRASFRLSVASASRIVVRQKTLNVRLALTEPALVRGHLVSTERIARTKAGRRIVWRMNWWERPVRAGATIVPLPLPRNFTIPGRYTLVIRARSQADGEVTTQRIPVTAVARAAPSGNAVVVVGGKDLPSDTDLNLDGSFTVATAEPATAFETTARPAGGVQALVVDVDGEDGVVLVRQLRLVFPMLRILAVSPAALAGQARAAGANVVVPEPASPELVAAALNALLKP